MGPPLDSKSDWVTVKTTLPTQPLPPNTERPSITTERMVLRTLTQDDLEQVWALRTQPEVMVWTGRGNVDADKSETQAKLSPFLPPNDLKTYNWAICDKESGDIIGIGGVHLFIGDRGWPEIGYMFRKEYWGKGLATEFVRAFLASWNQLPRSEVEIQVQPDSLAEGEGADGAAVEERLMAITVGDNYRSQNILTKCGFERFSVFKEPDLRDPSVEIELLLFRYLPGRALKN